MKSFSLSLLTTFTCLCQCTFGQTDSPEETEAWFVNPQYVQYIEDSSNDVLNLPYNAWEWNMTYLLAVMDREDPDFWYGDVISHDLILEILPPPYVSELDADVLAFYGLCDYLPENVTLNCTLPDSDLEVCVKYLVVSKYHPNPVSDQATEELPVGECGLKCSAGHLVYGLKEADQLALNIIKGIVCSLGLIGVSFLFYSQWSDIRESRGGATKFSEKPLIYHIPFIISIATFLLLFSITIGEVIGRRRMMCNDDGSFSFNNPVATFQPACFFFGIIFYASLQTYLWYTAFLAFALFRQFYRPLKPFWGIRKIYWHALLIFIVILLSSVAIGRGSIGGVEPMGLCVPGGSDKWDLFGLMTLPMILSTVVVIACLAGSGWYIHLNLQKLKEGAGNAAASKNVNELAHRMIWYTLSILVTLILLTSTGIVFFESFEKIRRAMSDRIECGIRDYYLNTGESCKGGYSMHPFWFVSWVLTCAGAITSQIVLTCHAKARGRVKHAAEAVQSQYGRATLVTKKSVRNLVSKTSEMSSRKSKSSREKSSRKDTSKNTTESGENELPAAGSMGGSSKKGLKMERVASSDDHLDNDGMVEPTSQDRDGNPRLNLSDPSSGAGMSGLTTPRSDDEDEGPSTELTTMEQTEL